MVFLHIAHHDVERLLRMGSCPFPAFLAGIRKTTGLVAMTLVVGTSHIDAVFLNIVAVVTETENVVLV